MHRAEKFNLFLCSQRELNRSGRPIEKGRRKNDDHYVYVSTELPAYVNADLLFRIDRFNWLAQFLCSSNHVYALNMANIGLQL